MNTRILMALLLAVAGLFVSACEGGSTDVEERVGPLTIDVVSQGWAGGSRKQPEPETLQVSVSQGDTFVVPTIVDPVRVKVSDVDDEGMRIETSEQLIKDGDSFGDADDEFELEDGVPLELTTPSEDAGTTITLTIT